MLTQCQLRTLPDTPLEDVVRVHLSKLPLQPGDTSPPPRVVGISYAVQPQAVLDTAGCPVWGETAVVHADVFKTEILIEVPEVPERYVCTLIQPAPASGSCAQGRRACEKDAGVRTRVADGEF